jgi:hypothetical protein
MLLDSAATKDPTKKTTFAVMRIGFRPNMSENLAQIAVELAAASRYAEPIQVKPAADPKCSEMVGNAVVIIVVKKLAEFRGYSLGSSQEAVPNKNPFPSLWPFQGIECS